MTYFNSNKKLWNKSFKKKKVILKFEKKFKRKKQYISTKLHSIQKRLYFDYKNFQNAATSLWIISTSHFSWCFIIFLPELQLNVMAFSQTKKTKKNKKKGTKKNRKNFTKLSFRCCVFFRTLVSKGLVFSSWCASEWGVKARAIFFSLPW